MTPLQIARQEDKKALRYFFMGRDSNMRWRQLQERERKRRKMLMGIRNGLVFGVLLWALIFACVKIYPWL